ncbi:MAG: InlB B-repeat-containing protein [Christensenellaceae bacterium]|jgi:uncharacterized repeat protein (TIGR02543 family)|nr:InlB B-repeat-containing protein [Christensenellaceae bacterium]
MNANGRGKIKYFFSIFLLIIILYSLIACSEHKSITVVFEDGQGNLIEKIESQSGDLVYIEVPTREGHIFIGWFSDKEYTKQIDLTFFKPTSSTTLYAKWISEKEYEFEIIGDVENASVNFSKRKAKFNDEILVVVTPDSGYEVDENSIVAKCNEKELELIPITSTQPDVKRYNFLMPIGSVLISGTSQLKLFNVSYQIALGDGDVLLDIEQTTIESDISFQVIPAPGYFFLYAIIDNVRLDDTSFPMPAKDVLIQVYFDTLDESVRSEINIEIAGPGIVELSDDCPITGSYVQIFVTPAENYRLDFISLNGVNLLSTTFIAPKDTSTILVSFQPKISDTYELTILTSDMGVLESNKSFYYPGEEVELTVSANTGYFLDAVYIMDLIHAPENFTMPASNTTINPIFKKIKYDIQVDNSEDGFINVSCDKAYFGDNIKITIKTNKGKELKAIYVNNVILNDTNFNMPSNDVVISCEFRESDDPNFYEIIAYDEIIENHRLTITADKSFAKINETVNITVTYFGVFALNELRYYYLDNTSRAKSCIISGSSFVVPEDIQLASQITIDASVSQIASTQKFSILIDDSIKNIVSLDPSINENSMLPNSLIHLIFSRSSFDLKSVYYLSQDGIKINVSDVFKMPEMNITLFAEFKSQALQPITNLKYIYLRDYEIYHYANLQMQYLDERAELSNYLKTEKLNWFAPKITEILKVASDSSSFTAINTNSTQTAIELAEAAYFLRTNSLGKYRVFGTIVIITNTINASDAKDILSNGITYVNDWVLYKRNDGTYGVFSYTGNDTIISIPSQVNGRGVVYLPSGVFKGNAKIKSLNIGAINIIDDNAFEALIDITSIDLSNVSYMPETLLAPCLSLQSIYVATYNKAYGVIDGILYEKNRLKILRYPPKKNNRSVVLNPTSVTRFTSIGPFAFYGAISLYDLNIDRIVELGDYAFKDCINLKGGASDVFDINTVVRIGRGVFDGAENVTRLTIASLRSVQKNAFIIGKQTLTIILTGSNASGLNPVFFKENEQGMLILKTSAAEVDVHRKNALWSNYTECFTLTTFLPNTALVMFVSDGSYVNSLVAASIYDSVTLPRSPSKPDYVFNDWYLDKDFIVAIDTNTALLSYLTDNKKVLVLYGKFTESSFLLSAGVN